MITSCHGHKAVQAVDSLKTNLQNNFYFSHSKFFLRPARVLKVLEQFIQMAKPGVLRLTRLVRWLEKKFSNRMLNF